MTQAGPGGMMMDGPIPRSWTPWLLSVLRIVAGFLFVFHGTQKLFVWPVAEPRTAAPLVSLMGLAGILEVFGGGLLAAGLFTRVVAFILSGEMAFAYFSAHAPRNVWPILNGGELALLYCFLFLYLAAAGGGPWSLDAMRRGGRR
ncbi:MAG: DoxX family protein [Vicinamibacterales bacterium]